MLFEDLFRLGEKLPSMVGKKAPCCAYTFSSATLSAACAAWTFGLALMARSTRRLSSGEWNSVHHCAGMSRSCTRRWDSPPRTSADAVCVARDSRVYPVTVGAAGVSKSGPTAQPDSAKTATPAANLRG